MEETYWLQKYNNQLTELWSVKFQQASPIPLLTPIAWIALVIQISLFLTFLHRSKRKTWSQHHFKKYPAGWRPLCMSGLVLHFAVLALDKVKRRWGGNVI